MPSIALLYHIREYCEGDRAVLNALGSSVVDWWHAQELGTSLNLVATADTGTIAGHLQAADRSVTENSRRPGQCHFMLTVAPEHRRQGIGGALYNRAEQFAGQRGAVLLYASYMETPNSPAAAFLAARGFTPLERFLPSSVDLHTFDPEQFREAIHRAEAQGIRLLTYAEVGDSPEHRRKLYHLEQTSRATQPFREVGAYIAEPFDKWERGFAGWDQSALFLAVAAPYDDWVGVVTGLKWYYTGVHPGWRGRGIATALKARCLTEAKRRGITHMETENHEDNAAMLAVNRKLGFVFGTPEVACIKRLA